MHRVALSHGEGRFIANEEWIKKLQLKTDYTHPSLITTSLLQLQVQVNQLLQLKLCRLVLLLTRKQHSEH